MTGDGDWFPKRREVYYAALDKPRPVLIVSTDGRNERSKTVLIVPVSETYRDHPYDVVLEPGETGLGYKSAAKCSDITTIPKEKIDPNRLKRRIGFDRMKDVERAMQFALGIRSPE